MRPLVDPGPPLTTEQTRRYARHLLLPEVGVEGQRRLTNARVLVVGAGGLGSPVLLYLAAAGVGTIGVVDDDVVDVSNLQRQVVHGGDDVGRRKVDSARDAIAAVNPLVRVETHPERVGAANARALVAAYDVVVDGTDNFATRYLLNDACALEGRPYVWGSIFRFDGQVSVFWAGNGPCYRCLFPQAPPPGAVPSCAEGGVLGMLCGSIGSAQATEAVKLVVGVGEPLVGRVAVHSALAGTWGSVRVERDPDCALCGDRPTIGDVTDEAYACAVPAAPGAGDGALAPATLQQWLAEREAGVRDFALVDVREPAEREINQIPGSLSVPVADVDADALRGRPTVVYCRTGVRSARVLADLRAAGVEAWHVAGGVTAWVRDVDPDQPVY